MDSGTFCEIFVKFMRKKNNKTTLLRIMIQRQLTFVLPLPPIISLNDSYTLDYEKRYRFN